MIAGTLYIFDAGLEDGVSSSRDTTMTFTTFVCFDMWNALSCRSETKLLSELGFWTNRPFLYAVGASLFGQLLVIYVPLLQRIFQTESLGFWDMVKIIFLSSTVWLVDEGRKWLASRNRNKTWSKNASAQYSAII